MFDLYLLPLQLVNGHEEIQMDELLAASAPKRCERSRAQDRLLVLISLTSGKPYSPEENDSLLNEAVQTYFASRGSITAGLRAAAERLNAIMLDANLHATFETQQRSAVINLAAIRGEDFYLAHAGTTHTFVLTKTGLEIFMDYESGNRGLGVSRSTPMRYFQCTLQDTDVVLFSAKPPSGWTEEALKENTQQTLDHLRRRLMSLAGWDLNAALIQFRQGKGEIHRLKPRTRFIPAGGPPPAKDAAPQIPVVSSASLPQPQTRMEQTNLQEIPEVGTQFDHVQQAQMQPAEEEPDSTTLSTLNQDVSPEPVSREIPSVEPPPTLPPSPSITPSPDVPVPSAPFTRPKRPSRPITNAPEPEMKESEEVLAIPLSDAITASGSEVDQAGEENKPDYAWKESLTAWWLKLRSARRKVNQTATLVAGKLLPGDEQNDNSLSARNMLFIAIVVPLIVVAIAATVYFRLGRSERHNEYLMQAAQQVELAHLATDVQIQRETWNQALTLLIKAENYGKSDESRLMRSEIENSLDGMEGISRTLFQPLLVQQIPVGAKITRMVANLTEVYLLDTAMDQVLRLELSGNSYTLDESFICSAGTRGIMIVNELVDIVILPTNSPFGATVLAIDRTGNLMYCIPGEQPVVTSLASPDNSWGELNDMDLGGSNLFILDIPKDTILTYRGTNQSFDQNPNWFFDTDKPKLSDLIAITAYGNDLYMLHEDGSMSLCTYRLGRDDKTKCVSESHYQDERQGADPKPVILKDTHFIQMMSTEPPDPSLYVLDANTPSIYQFSLRQTFIKQIRPATTEDFPLPKSPATAFVVTPGRYVLLVFDNLLYAALLP